MINRMDTLAKDKGMTLLEVLISVVILAVGMRRDRQYVDSQ